MGETTALVSWDEEDWATAFEVNYSEVGFQGKSSTIELRVPTGWINAFENITGLDPGTTYTFKVRAYGDGLTYASVWGDWSDPVDGTTEAISSKFPGPSACCNGVVVPDPSTNSSLVSDCEALLSALTIKKGQSTPVPLDWSASEPLTTEWVGIATGDGTSSWLRGEVVQRITGLNLSNRSLSETLNIDWEEVATLDALETLDMSGNGFSGSIPERFHLLDHLQHLRLANNNLTGDIPQQLERLTNLRTLSLYDNNLTGQIPNGLGELRNLSTVLLSDNGFGGVLPPAFGNTNIIHLDLSNNLIGGPVPVQYGQLTNVTHLDLSNNQLSGEIPPQLGNLNSLYSIKLAGANNNFEGCIPPELAYVPVNDLSSLGLSFCFPEIPGPSFVWSCPGANRLRPHTPSDDIYNATTLDGVRHSARAAMFKRLIYIPNLEEEHGEPLVERYCAFAFVANASSMPVNTVLRAQVYWSGSATDAGSLHHSTPSGGVTCTNSKTCTWRGVTISLPIGEGLHNHIYVYGNHHISSDSYEVGINTSAGFYAEYASGGYVTAPPLKQ